MISDDNEPIAGETANRAKILEENLSNTELSGADYEQVRSRSGNFFFHFLTESFCKYGISVLYRRNFARKQKYLNTGLF